MAEHRAATSPGIYCPDNPLLEDVLVQSCGRGFRLDHARLFLHFICAKRWMHYIDEYEFARLNAGILRWYIQPRALGALKRYLTDNGVLITSPHSAGNYATGYSIAPAFDGPPKRYEIQYAPLAQKIRDFRAACGLTQENPDLHAVVARRRPLLDHFRDSLDMLSLPDTPEAMVEDLADEVDPEHVAYVAQCIKYCDHRGLTIDGFGWRVHHLITMTSSHLRPRLLLNGSQVAEVDVANSQPMLLSLLLQEAKRAQETTTPSTPERRGGRERDSSGGVPRPSIMLCIRSICCAFEPFVRAVPSQEIQTFLCACESGELYDLLAGDVGIDRQQAKHELFRDVLFGRPNVHGPLTRAFSSHWPHVLEAIRQAKQQLGYKSISQALQRLESVIMLDDIAFRLMDEFPGVPFLTIHDSALLVAASAEQVKALMLEEFGRWGINPTIRIKAPAVGSF